MKRLAAVLLTLAILAPSAQAGTKRTIDQRVRRHVRAEWVADWREDQALAVFTCESGLNPWASNGQYLGVAQMGEHERAITGWKWRIRTQIRAAKRYFNMTGRAWGPWTCRYVL